ncbi:glucosaminidase domain-containing protein [Mucilaginibacter sp.]|uniref:glycoside hydrolase family 73 protein n=1 Tax=Mucilaginibacter sp. TaxID=1882438 RepID=UPI002848D5D3|nr:glucosaminidase domain-containing protein [Mucilaginibacter sp.]MDR3696980.1 glucosaminidase domain-containing protein [Mucilaginibacter sp.]
MKKLLLVTLLLVPFLMASAQKNTPQSYIDQFKEDAIRIMHETGVPASIVLGVAMHESGCGNSALAKNLNNQFGVKGGSRIVYYNKHNKKVNTAYKKYGSVYDSFEDFARIMTERQEFSGLSDKFTHFDYQGWAHGIQKHGYAHDRRWSKYVLGIINKYHLYLFDEKPANQDQLAQNN